MFYYYYNPRTKKGALLKDHNSVVAESLVEDKNKDIIISVSGYSNTIKVYKWHFQSYAGDYEDCLDMVAEMPLGVELIKCVLLKSLGL